MDAFVYENGTLWQYDAGQKMRVNIDIPDKALVHFSNSESLFVSVVRAAPSIDVTIDAKKFIVAACPADGEVFNFEWSDGQWTLNDAVVELAYYGITATEPEYDGDSFTVACNAVAAVEVTDGYAAIPNQALLSGGVLNVYAYTEDESGARTIVRNTFIICERALPPDYVYTETPVINYTTLINLIAEISTALQKITNVSASASTLPEDEEATASAELSDAGLTFTFGIPQGKQGAPGKDAVVDPTLSVEGEAADAKATGEAIAAAAALAERKYTLPINGIPTSDIADGAITNNELANGAVTNTKIADGTIQGAKLADGAVYSSKIGDNAVTTAKINGLAVTAGKLGPAAVTTPKIADSAVTEAKLANPNTILLWTNPDQSAGMGNYAVVRFDAEISFAIYKWITIEFAMTGTSNEHCTMTIPAETFSADKRYNAVTDYGAFSAGGTARGRQITGLWRDSIRFGIGYEAGVQNALRMVPTKIWARK